METDGSEDVVALYDPKKNSSVDRNRGEGPTPLEGQNPLSTDNEPSTETRTSAAKPRWEGKKQ